MPPATSRPQHGGPRPGSGRPAKLPKGSRVQTYRGTDEEHAKLMADLRRMRAKAKKESAK